MIPKFRTWYKNTKSMWNIERWHVEDEYFDLIEPNKSVADPNANRVWRKQSDVILMQSTGLRDKNGVEIFEGDIVSHFDGEFSYKGVVTQDGVTCWWIEGLDQDDNFSFGDVTDYTYHTCDLVVKGNIYENQELLEDV